MVGDETNSGSMMIHQSGGGGVGGVLIPPDNFSMVEPGLYRSSFPRRKNMEFLKNLDIKTVIALIPEDYPTNIEEFYSLNGIRLIKHGLDGNKWPFKEIDQEAFRKALVDSLDPKNRPVLIHCNKGKHRTGSLIGVIRKVRKWALTPILHEYILFATPKARIEDQLYIEQFNIIEFNEILYQIKEQEKV